MTFDGVGRDHGATGVPAPSRQMRNPARGRKKPRAKEEEDTLTRFLQRVSAGEGARRSKDKGESTRE